MHSLLDIAWYSFGQALGNRVVGGFPAILQQATNGAASYPYKIRH
jgi:hypothetical protein